ncbi:MAG TPA: S4 domain-containing protein [Gemmatimonadales bacterium]
MRIDKWLWAARFYKTRALAALALDGGKVELNGERAKRARAVRPGDRIRLRHGSYEYLLTVRAVSERRGPASVAVTLYQEDPESKDRRERLAEQHRLAATAFDHGEGKPSKKQRREIRRLKGQ